MATHSQKKLLAKAANDLARYQDVLENPRQSREFYRKLHKQAVFLPLCTSKVLTTRSETWPIIDDEGETPLLHPAFESTPQPSSQEYRPVATKKEITSNFHNGRVRISRLVLEENLAKEGLTDLIREATNKKLAKELEDIHLLGVGPGGGVGYANKITESMKLQLGLVERIKSVNIYNANGGAMTYDRFMEMLAMLPDEHEDGSVSMFLNHRAQMAMRQDLAARATALGDTMIGTSKGPIVPRMVVSGIPFVKVPRIPGTWGTQATNRTFGFLANPKLALVAYFRRPEFEMWRDPLSDSSFLIVRMRMGNQWYETEGTVFAQNVAMLNT